MPAPPQLYISGVVHHGYPVAAAAGDVRICPGVNHTSFIDGFIFDGLQWRRLDLGSLGAIGRRFGIPEEIGSVMRNITSSVKSFKGMPVHYERIGESTRSKYVFRGIPFSQFRR